MSNPPNLLNDDGTASIATAIMMSHHGFRRDLARFTIALERVESGDGSKLEALREEWGRFKATLHGHHQAEDAGVFPNLKSQQAALTAVIDRLSADHRRIDPLLARGDDAFAQLPETGAAMAVVSELKTLLDAHLATEEAEVFPYLRDAKQFPPPANDAEAAMYAEGFAWASHGVCPQVLEQVNAMLPEILRSKLPAARAAFDARCEKVWGSARAGASTTSVPDPT
jgi:iron-sulfur cluster repair protein YtfE (RIC family)